MPGDLPAPVVEFLNERIDSVPHLEALLIMWHNGGTWDAAQMSARIYVDKSTAQALLQDLQRAGLAASEDRISFKFDARSAAAQTLMPQLAESYKRNVTRIATLIHNKASSPVREFARAFELKKER